MRTLLLFCVVFGICESALAFDPRTHLWIAQQVLNDVVPDGKLTIDGREYKIDERTVASLRAHPQIFRMGNIGPDAHPDLIVGQSFLHPGPQAGWGADDWAKWIDDCAAIDGSLEARAYAAGFWCHMAADVLMHTYVNLYAGDYFALFDEQEVELRHFALEHYIGDRTPILRDHTGAIVDPFDVKWPSQFLAKTLVLNDTVADQYIKYPGYASHLLAMYRIHKTVHDLRVTVEKLEEPVKTRLAELDELRLKTAERIEKNLEQITKETLTLNPLILSVEALSKAVEAQREINRPIEALASAAEKLVLDASNEVSRCVTEIDAATRRLNNEVSREIAHAEREIDRLKKELERWQAEIENQRQSVANLAELKDKASREVDRLSRRLDGILRHVPLYREISRELNNAKDSFNGVSGELAKAEDNLRNSIDNVTNLGGSVTKTAGDLAQWVRERTRLSDLISSLGAARDKAKEELQRATAAIGDLSADLRAARDALAAKLNPYEEALKALDDLKSLLQRLEDEKNKAISDAAEYGRELRQLLSLSDGVFSGGDIGLAALLKNWERDIELATEAYIDAASESLLATMRGGNPLQPIQDWFVCWAPVFSGIPSEILNVGCKGVAYAREVANRIKTLAEELALQTPVVRDFVKEYTLLKERLKGELVSGSIDIADHLFGSAFTKFYTLKSEHWTDDKLTNVFSTDSSGKQLLLLPDIVLRVRKDLGTNDSDAKFDPNVFPAAIHAVTLAKLSVLDALGVDELGRHYGIVDTAKEYVYSHEAKEDARRACLYPDGSKFENILFRGVRSLDGNQQWRGVGLPYLRRNGQFENTEGNRFGYCQSSESPSDGFRLWVDPEFRSKAFSKLFPGDLKMKALAIGLADLIPAELELCDNELQQCLLCSGSGAGNETPKIPEAPFVRTPEERVALEESRAIQVLDVPFVRLVDRIDGKNQQQVEDAIREDVRVKLQKEIREEILNELRHSQEWSNLYGDSFRRAKDAKKLLLVIVKGDSASGDFRFDELIADGLQAALLGKFQLCEIALNTSESQHLLRCRAGTVLPAAFVIDPDTTTVIWSRGDVTSHLAWAEVLVEITRIRETKR